MMEPIWGKNLANIKQIPTTTVLRTTTCFQLQNTTYRHTLMTENKIPLGSAINVLASHLPHLFDKSNLT